MKCPICGTELVQKYHDAINMGICESLYVCEDCKLYAEQFAYGGYEITIGSFVVHYSHNTNEIERWNVEQGIKDIIEVYKSTRIITHPRPITQELRDAWNDLLKD